MKKRLCFFLALAMLAGMLSACTLSRNSVNTDGGDRIDGSWEGVDFGGQEVRVSVSANQSFECMFPAADIYTRGPDTAGSSEVLKEVLARNTQASEELGIKIVYSETDLRYDEILEDVRTASVFEKSGICMWVCRNCGHVVMDTKAPAVCEVCHHPRAYFQVNEREA